jgi:hypothetical protein
MPAIAAPLGLSFPKTEKFRKEPLIRETEDCEKSREFKLESYHFCLDRMLLFKESSVVIDERGTTSSLRMELSLTPFWHFTPARLRE